MYSHYTLIVPECGLQRHTIDTFAHTPLILLDWLAHTGAPPFLKMKLAVLPLLLIAAAAAVNAQPSVGCNDKSKVHILQNPGARVTQHLQISC